MPEEPKVPTTDSTTPPPNEDIDEGGTATETKTGDEGMTSSEIDLKGKGAVRLDRFTPEDIAKFGKGAIDAGVTLRLPRFGDFAGPVAFDWNKGFDQSRIIPLTVNDQGGSLSCTFQAWSKYVAVLNFLETKEYTDFSARFGYARTFLPGGGAWLFSGGDIITLAGVPKETTTPSYTSSGRPLTEAAMQVRDDRPEALKEALTYRTKSPAYVRANIDEMAKAIRDQHGMIFGFTGSNEGMVTGGTGIIRPPKKGEVLWGHAVLAIGAGLISGKKYLKFINSWSENWGQFGYGYLGEDYIISGRTFDGLTLIDLPNLHMALTEREVQLIYRLSFYRAAEPDEEKYWTGKTLELFLQTAIKDRSKFLSEVVASPLVTPDESSILSTPPTPPTLPTDPKLPVEPADPAEPTETPPPMTS